MFKQIAKAIKQAKDGVNELAPLAQAAAVTALKPEDVAEVTSDAKVNLGTETETALAISDKKAAAKQSSGLKLYTILGSIAAAGSSVFAGFIPKLFNLNLSGLGLALGTFGSFLGALLLGTLAFRTTNNLSNGTQEQAVEATNVDSAAVSSNLVDAVVAPKATVINGMNLENDGQQLGSAEQKPQQEAEEASKNKLRN